MAAGQTYAISGTITVDDRFVLESGTIITAEGAYAGTLAWNLDTREGSCSLSLAVSLIDGGLVVSGTACGVEVEHAV